MGKDALIDWQWNGAEMRNRGERGLEYDIGSKRDLEARASAENPPNPFGVPELSTRRTSKKTHLGRSRAHHSGFLGKTPMLAWEMLQHIWECPVFVSSNAARSQWGSEMIAFLASMGWVSTITPDGKGYTRRWHVTREGITALNTRGR